MERSRKFVPRRNRENTRSCTIRLSRAVTPGMLVRTLKTLQESKLIGVYFNSYQITERLMELYPEIDHNFSQLHQEVKDKLICAANADIIGFKFDRGYHLLSASGHCTRIDTCSKLTFWLLYKKLIDARNKSQKSMPRLFRAARSSP